MCIVFVEFERSQYNVREDAGSVMITLELNQRPGVEVNALVTTADATATSKCLLPVDYHNNSDSLGGSDYNGGQFPVQFSATQQAQTLRIGIIDNNIVENNELFRLRLTAEGLLAVGSRAMATVNITDDEGY